MKKTVSRWGLYVGRNLARVNGDQVDQRNDGGLTVVQQDRA